jgi:L,D-transpeptidase YbiS
MSIKNQHIEISLKKQKLYLFKADKSTDEFDVSTADNGAGEKMDSECTPRGLHKIHEKIGDGCEPGTVFIARKPTGEIYNPDLACTYPQRDWILTRILRLSGEEKGINQGGDVDTLERMIYIHGSPENIQLGVPGSHGCIRMKNEHVIRLFDTVEVGTKVYIKE